MFDLDDRRKALRARARELARGPIASAAAETDRSEAYPWANVEALREAGFFGMTIPEALGGGGRDHLDVVLVIEEMAKACGVTGRIVVEANMGAIGAIMAYGDEGQKRAAADLVLAGDKPAICITEPGAGSDAGAMTTRAEKRGDRWVIDGVKHWITGGGVSKLHLIFARAFEAGEPLGIAGFLAYLGEEGLIVAEREPTMGLRGIPETRIELRGLSLPEDRLLLPPGGFARGFAELMNAYNAQRVGAATVALGIAAGAFERARDYLGQREQFGRPIAEFQGLQWMLADMGASLEAARSLVWRAASSGGRFPDPLLAAQAKVIASEAAIEVTKDALQLHGAAGYSRNLPLERMARDARMFTIGGGTAQVLRTLIASKYLDRKLPQRRGGYLDLDREKAHD